MATDIEFPNKIEFDEVNGFVPCKLCGCEYTYPDPMYGTKNTIRLSYHSTSNTFEIDLNGEEKIYLNSYEMDIIDDWIKKLKS